jgi:drug/metabolite transporter (DMT)-like permease
MADRIDNRSLGDLLAELTRDLSTLIRKEAELARTEIGARIGFAARNAGLAAAGGAFALGGLLVLLAAAVLGFAALGLDPWLAAFLVGLATVVIGYILVNAGLSRMKRTTVVPVRAMESIKEDAKWVTGQKA